MTIISVGALGFLICVSMDMQKVKYLEPQKKSYKNLPIGELWAASQRLRYSLLRKSWDYSGM